jgi:hypothetical protein
MKSEPNRQRAIRAAKVPGGLLVRNVGALTDTRAFDFYGNAAYALNITITVNLPHFAIAGFGLEVPWDSYVWWLDEPREIKGRATVYRFDRSDPLEFDRGEVLNHSADVRRTLSRGKSLSGYLLGVGNKPIPDEFQQGAIIPAFLIVHDQFERAYRSPISIWRDKTIQPVRRACSGHQRKGGLLDKLDPGFKHLPLEKEDEPEK